jgi:hypothetical protein
MTTFQKSFAALSAGYFVVTPTGPVKKWLMQFSDWATQGRMIVDLPEFDPNYRFAIHESSAKKRTAPGPVILGSGEKIFTYDEVPLQGGTSIRLVTVHANAKHAQSSSRNSTGDAKDVRIECTLKVATLGDGEEYEALSYTWGDPTANSLIMLNGAPILIAENLHAFLSRLRSGSDAKPKTFWIDGLCINQANDAEKSAQVNLMKDIYKNATSVRVWLGEQTDSTAAAFELASALAALESHVDKGRVLSREEMENPKTGLLADATGLPNWKALDLIYWQQWFSRTWVIQEIALARDAVVQCGSHTVSWADLVTAARFLVEHHLVSHVDIDPSPILAMQVYRDAIKLRGGLNLLELMYISRSSWCGDPKDKIYGLLGIASDIMTDQINPDYSRSVEDTYRSLARFFIRRDKNLDVFSAIEDYKWRLHKTLPSWVPDWTSHPRSTPFLSRPDHWHFKASGDTTPKERTSPSMHLASPILCLRGKIVDKVKRVSSPDIPVRAGYPGLRETLYARQTLALCAAEQRQHWENMVKRMGPRYPAHPTEHDTPETPLEALAHTIVAEGAFDALPGEEIDTSDLHGLYASWKRHWKYMLNHRMHDLPEHPTHEELEEQRRAAVYSGAWREAFRFRRLFTTRKGYMGLSSYSTRPGDVVCILYGGKTAYILRKLGNEEGGRERWMFVGEAYVRGLMQGQGLRDGFGEEVDFEFV